jgi:hypothetical protein
MDLLAPQETERKALEGGSDEEDNKGDKKLSKRKQKLLTRMRYTRHECHAWVVGEMHMGRFRDDGVWLGVF